MHHVASPQLAILGGGRLMRVRLVGRDGADPVVEALRERSGVVGGRQCPFDDFVTNDIERFALGATTVGLAAKNERVGVQLVTAISARNDSMNSPNMVVRLRVARVGVVALAQRSGR